MNARPLAPSSPVSGDDLVLLCFTHAGGNVSAFQRWSRSMPPGLRVLGVEYPGRGSRVTERPIDDFELLTADLWEHITPFLDRPYALFGHSMGGLIAFELARTLVSVGMEAPLHLFVSATAAPGNRPNGTSLTGATDAEVLAELRALGGTPQVLLDDPGVMDMAVRALRADYTVLESYRHRHHPPLPVPLTVMGAREDMVAPLAGLTAWKEHTVDLPRFLVFPGDHFFVHAREAEVIDTVIRTLTGVPATP